MDPTEKYFKDRDKQIDKNYRDHQLHDDISAFMDSVHRTNYIKNFSWSGRPIIQLPQDLMALQELLYQIKPDFIIECGIAFGGLTIFCATLMDRINMEAHIFAIDIKIRDNTEKALSNITFPYIHQIESSSTSLSVIKEIKKEMAPFVKAHRDKPCLYDMPGVIVFLDSNHTHDHVLQELKLYAPLVSVGSYIVVFDTLIEFLDPKYIPADRPWGKGNNPFTAVQEFMKGNHEFEVDTDIEMRILLTSAPGGWLKRIKEAK